MKEVELVIKIPEEMYEWVNDANKVFNDYGTSDFIDLVKSGTPLPKGHGRLIDADAINLKDISPVDGFSVYGATVEDIDLTPTVLEADEVES